MKLFIIIASVIGLALVIFNATKLDFSALLQGDSLTALITMFTALCAVVLLQILRVSKKIERLEKNR
jgi:hypothetical protein